MPDLHGWITQQIDRVEAIVQDPTGAPWAAVDHLIIFGPDAVLRRCAADRKILARHTLDPDVHYEPACKGCGTYGDMELPETDNLNECPELLDLAEGYGLTPEILATLDQPVPLPMPERPKPRVTDLNALVRLISAKPTSSVPPALRGPKWKA